MALSPEDVIKKSFGATHLRRGYDETQVDDFLDEVVIELRRLNSENDSLRTELEDCRASRGLGGDQVAAPVAVPGGEAGADDAVLEERRHQLTAELEELQAQVDAKRAEAESADTGPVVTGGETEEIDGLRRELEACQQARAELEDRLQQVEMEAEAARADGAPVAAAAGAAGADATGGEASSIISLAQRLHDEHVAEGESTKARLVEEGQAEHDRLVTEGQAQHDELVRTGEETKERLVTEGQSRSEQLVDEAEQQRAGVLDDLTTQQTTLTRKISELQTQETDLRDRLRAFLSDQLAKIEAGRS